MALRFDFVAPHVPGESLRKYSWVSVDGPTVALWRTLVGAYQEPNISTSHLNSRNAYRLGKARACEREVMEVNTVVQVAEE